MHDHLIGSRGMVDHLPGHTSVDAGIGQLASTVARFLDYNHRETIPESPIRLRGTIVHDEVWVMFRETLGAMLGDGVRRGGNLAESMTLSYYSLDMPDDPSTDERDFIEQVEIPAGSQLIINAPKNDKPGSRRTITTITVGPVRLHDGEDGELKVLSVARST